MNEDANELATSDMIGRETAPTLTNPLLILLQMSLGRIWSINSFPS